MSIKIEKWSFINVTQNGEDFYRIDGLVQGHPSVRDGERILTSFVLGFILSSNTVITKNTEYELGTPSSNTPFYRQRFVNKLREKNLVFETRDKMPKK